MRILAVILLIAWATGYLQCSTDSSADDTRLLTVEYMGYYALCETDSECEGIDPY
jgi:hypothetical protein